MTRMIPRPLYGPVSGNTQASPEHGEETVIESNPRCVHCALERSSKPLTQYFIVSGTSLCETHMIRVMAENTGR